MSYENVKLWFAKDSEGKITTIDEINNENKNNKYLCPMCGSDLIPKAIKSNQITSHFAHINASKCNSETMIHWWFKNAFLVQGDKFRIKSDIEREYVCKEVLIEQSINVGDKIYRPDITILTECGKTIYFEMDYSNKKKLQDYIDIWLELKNIVVEVDIKKLMFKDKIPVFKALFYNGKCFNTNKNDLYYNIIGKYKEEKLGNLIIIDFELKQKIQKLDWFWNDIFEYKNNKKDVYEIFNIINSIDNEIERNIIVEVLKKLNCIEIIQNLYELRLKNARDYLNSILVNIDNNLSLKNEQYYTKYYDKMFREIHFSVYYKNKFVTSLDNYKSIVGYEEVLKNKISDVENDIKLEYEISLFQEKYSHLKDYITVDNNKIKILNLYKTRNFYFEIYSNHVNYSKEYWIQKNYDFKLVDELIERFSFESNNYNLAFEYIVSKIFIELEKAKNRELNLKLKNNEISRKEYLKIKTHKILDMIYKILKNSPEKILDCRVNYDLDNKYYNSIWFKDYKKRDFIFCNKECLDIDLDVIKNIKIINIKNLSYENIFIFENKTSYSIKKELNLYYDYDNYFNNKKIYFSFKTYSNAYKYLDNFDFISVQNKINDINMEIENLIDNKLKSDKIIESQYIKDENIDKSLNNLLKPISSLCNFKKEEDIRIQLNINYTKKNNRYEPWVIKDFIDNLNYISYFYKINIINIK